MADIEDPPIYSEFADAMDVKDGGKVPPLKVTRTWMLWFYSVLEQLLTASRRKASLPVADSASASLAVTPIPIADLPAGLWRVSYIARIVQAAGVSSSLEVTIHWIDAGVAQTETGTAMIGNATTEHQTRTYLIRSDAEGPISVSTTYASVGAPVMLYDLNVVVEEVDTSVA